MPDTPFDPDIDIDPNDVIEQSPDPETNTDEDPANDDAGQAHEDVPDAQPVDDAVADVDVPTIEED